MIFKNSKINEAFKRLLFITTFGVALKLNQIYVNNKFDQQILKDIKEIERIVDYEKNK